MCLTIPKKVISLDNGEIVLESFDDTRQSVKSMIPLNIGDYVLTQQNIVVEKIGKEEAEEVLTMFNNLKGE